MFGVRTRASSAIRKLHSMLSLSLSTASYRYVLHARAGSSSKLFSNSAHARDCDEDGVRSDR